MIWFGVFATLALTAAWYRTSLRATAIAFAVALGFYALFGASFLMFLLLALLWLAVFIPLLLVPLRQEWVARPLLEWLHTRAGAQVEPQTPASLSPAAAALARGALDWPYWLSAPLPALAPLEQAYLDGPVETVCRTWPGPPAEIHLSAAAVPLRYGGEGFSAFACQALLTKVASGAGLPAARALAQVFGCVALIDKYGNEAQKEEWLRQIAHGTWMCALQEPAAHGHAGLMPDVAVIERGIWKGRETEGLRLNYAKRAVAGCAQAQAVWVAAAIRNHPALGEGWILIHKGIAGVADDLLSGREVFVPLHHLLSAPLSQPFAGGDRALLMAGRVSALTEQAAVQHRLAHDPTDSQTLLLARLGACAYALEALRRCAPDLESPALHQASAHYAAQSDSLIEKLGLHPVNPAERELHAESAAPIQPQLYRALSEDNPALALQQFDLALIDAARQTGYAAVRALLLGLTHGRLQPAPVLGPLRHFHGRVSRYSAAASLLSSALPWMRATAGRAALRRELSEIDGRLCAAASVLRCFEKDARPPADAAFALWTLAQINRDIEQALDSALHTLPSRWLSVLLRLIVFPLGRWARPPREAWTGAMVQRLQDTHAPPICPLVFLSAPLLRLRAAFQLQQECAELEPRLNDPRLRQPRRLDRIHEALGLGLLNAEETARLRELQNLSESEFDAPPPAQQSAAPQANLHAESEYDT